MPPIASFGLAKKSCLNCATNTTTNINTTSTIVLQPQHIMIQPFKIRVDIATALFVHLFKHSTFACLQASICAHLHTHRHASDLIYQPYSIFNQKQIALLNK